MELIERFSLWDELVKRLALDSSPECLDFFVLDPDSFLRASDTECFDDLATDEALDARCSCFGALEDDLPPLASSSEEYAVDLVTDDALFPLDLDDPVFRAPESECLPDPFATDEVRDLLGSDSF